MRIANRAGAALLGAALIVLIFAVVIFRRDYAEFAAMDAESDCIHAIVDASQAALSDLKDAETGQRGYLLTGKGSYLAPYSFGTRHYRQSLAQLRELTSGDAAVSPLVEKAATRGQHKLDEMAYSIATAKEGNRAGAIERVNEDVGKTYMDEFRGFIGQIVQIEEASHKQNEQLVEKTQASTRNGFLIADALLFMLTLAGTVLLSIEIRYERRLAASLEAGEKKYRDLAESLEDQVAVRTTELRQLNTELMAFSYSVSHDLRAPLRSIDGFSLMVLEDYADRLDDAGRDMLKRIRTAAKRMGQLIQSLLELSRVTRQDLKRERISLTSMAESVIDSLAAASPTREVSVSVAPDLEVDADPQLMRVVMDNLLANAWKFTSRTESGRIEVGKTVNDGKSVFYVRDNGAGFDSSRAERLFAPFQRLHPESEFEGTGIGLATVQRVLRRHGGLIWAESKRGEGATFFFEL